MPLVHKTACVICEQTNPQVANFCESKLRTCNMQAKRAQHIAIVYDNKTHMYNKQTKLGQCEHTVI